MAINYPFTPGQKATGTIVALGANVSHLKDDEHFMFATGAREAGRPNRAPASG
jgi:NADPH:quinone reductase-like Zn-dependent oxidoreductase